MFLCNKIYEFNWTLFHSSVRKVTERLYLTDSYVREFDCKVLNKVGNALVLDRTAFYPGGGGQPSDSGRLVYGNAEFNVAEVRSDGDQVIHVLDSDTHISEGDRVRGIIDWERRYMHMRLHTAFHIIDGVVESSYHGSVIGGQIYDDKASIDFDIPGMDKDTVVSITSKAQEIVDSSRRVYPKMLPREEALSITNLSRTQPGKKLLERLDEVRVIVIEGSDMQMDGGTHVSNTKEVGRIDFVKYRSKGQHDKRVEIRLE